MSSEEPEEKSSAPLPHFDVLRQEVEDDTMKVQEFLKGSFTYKVQERKNVRVYDRKKLHQTLEVLNMVVIPIQGLPSKI